MSKNLQISNQEEITSKITRFSYEKDLQLLRLFVAKPVYDEAHRKSEAYWAKTAKELGFENFRVVRDRYYKLLRDFKNNDGVQRRSSGLEEQYEEKEQLLQECVDLEREHKENANKSSNKKKTPMEVT